MGQVLWSRAAGGAWGHPSPGPLSTARSRPFTGKLCVSPRVRFVSSHEAQTGHAEREVQLNASLMPTLQRPQGLANPSSASEEEPGPQTRRRWRCGSRTGTVSARLTGRGQRGHWHVARGQEAAPGQAGTGRSRQAEETGPSCRPRPKAPAGDPDGVCGAEIRAPRDTTPSHFQQCH